MLWAVVVSAVVIWCYLGRVSIRWDKCADDTPCPPLAFILWILVFPALWHRKPPCPWSITDPIKVIPAEEMSLQMERETGLEFDGIFLRPGYAKTYIEDGYTKGVGSSNHEW